MEWGRGRRVTGDQGMGGHGRLPIPQKTTCIAPQVTVDEKLLTVQDGPKHWDMSQTRITSNGVRHETVLRHLSEKVLPI